MDNCLIVNNGLQSYAKNDPCPEGWRVPTKKELLTLKNINSKWVTQNGINGRLFGTAPNQVFLPAAGERDGRSTLSFEGEWGHYWSSIKECAVYEICEEWEGYEELLEDLQGAWFLWIYNDNAFVAAGSRFVAYSIRCVAKTTYPTTTTCNVTDEGVVINGVRWATRNVDMPGTFAETPESAGMFFQWNRKKAWNVVDEEVVGWDSSIPTGTKWYAENDPCPEGWRVPTGEELCLLYDYAGSEWTIKNGVNGRIFGTAPNQIFLPAINGRRSVNGNLGRDDMGIDWGYYWGSTSGNPRVDGQRMWFNTGDINPCTSADRTYGFSIRCVAIE
jgi:uncharacterized protein (TIGR02145 family)